MLDMPGTPVGTTKGAHCEPTDSETIPDGGCSQRHTESSTQHRVPNIIQSNGLAEKAMQTAKRIIMKANASGRDPYIALLEYRVTRISDCGKSLAQL